MRFQKGRAVREYLSILFKESGNFVRVARILRHVQDVDTSLESFFSTVRANSCQPVESPAKNAEYRGTCIAQLPSTPISQLFVFKKLMSDLPLDRQLRSYIKLTHNHPYNSQKH